MAPSATWADVRDSAISTALHSTLVMTKDGMNLHALASYAGHDVQTMERYYSQVIGRYRASQPIDLERECEAARLTAGAQPFAPAEQLPGPQRDTQRRRRSHARAARTTAAAP